MSKPTISRVRPGDSEWPSEVSWNRLNQEVGGQLIKVLSPLVACIDAPSRLNCTHVFKQLKNPYYLGDEVGLTQTLGWVGAWTSRPSAYAVAVRTTQDVVAAVNFARENNLRIVVKGGGHSYQGTSNSVDSLLIWTSGGIQKRNSGISQEMFSRRSWNASGPQMHEEIQLSAPKRLKILCSRFSHFPGILR
jgi:FAD binding domain